MTLHPLPAPLEPLSRAAQLSVAQRQLIRSVVERLARLTGIQAVVLGGSYARGRARAGSDIDLGLLYRDAAPFSIDEIRALARQLNATPDPAVAGFYEWGQWVNGGTGLTIEGQRVDLLYKNLDQLERVIADARAGHHEQAYYQQPPFGFHSDTFLAELETCIPLFDPEGVLPGLQQRVAEYPEALRLRLVQDSLGGARFDLYTAEKSALVGDPYLTCACLTRSLDRIVHALFALNRRYRVNDKTALDELAEFPRLPAQFAVRVRSALSRLGESREELLAAVERIRALSRETEALEPELLAIGEDSPAWLRVQKQAGTV
jgi:predicted nucleotidyltransferase